jgi:phosphatidylglycerol:prolipoprotein diacylglycerol transferase
VAADYRQFLPGFPFSVFDARLKGMAAYGGFLGGFLALWGLARYRRWPAARIADMAAVGAALGSGFARIGCFLAGCCFGCPAALPWAVVFPAGSPAYAAQRRQGLIPADALGSLAVHPVQLYESAFGFGLFGLLLWVYRRRKADGSVTLAFFGFYAMFRFWAETLRCDAVRGVFAGLSTSQYIALATAAAVVLVRLLQRRSTRADPAP